MNLLKTIDRVTEKKNASKGAEKLELTNIEEWLTLLSGLIACVGHGIGHTWGMSDRECVERCYDMIEEAEKRLDK